MNSQLTIDKSKFRLVQSRLCIRILVYAVFPSALAAFQQHFHVEEPGEQGPRARCSSRRYLCRSPMLIRACYPGCFADYSLQTMPTMDHNHNINII